MDVRRVDEAICHDLFPASDSMRGRKPRRTYPTRDPGQLRREAMGSAGQEFDSPPERTRALDPTVVDDRIQRQSTRTDAAGDRRSLSHCLHNSSRLAQSDA